MCGTAAHLAHVFKQVLIATGIDPNDPNSLAKRHARDNWTDAKMAADSDTRSNVRSEIISTINLGKVYWSKAWFV